MYSTYSTTLLWWYQRLICCPSYLPPRCFSPSFTYLLCFVSFPAKLSVLFTIIDDDHLCICFGCLSVCIFLCSFFFGKVVPEQLNWLLICQVNQKVDFFKDSCSSLGETAGPSCTPTHKLKVLAAWLALWLPPPCNTESLRRIHRDVRLRGWAERKDKAWRQENNCCCTIRTFVQHSHIFTV